MWKLISVFASGTTVYLLSSSETSAAEVSLGIYPPLTRIHSGAGAHITSPISVINNTDSLMILGVTFLPFRASDQQNGAIEYYNTKETPQDLSDFLKTITVLEGDKEVANITAFPRQYKNFTISFNAPLKEKDYYFSVVLTAQNNAEKTDSTRITINPSISTNVLLSVNRKEQNGLINQFDTKSVILNGPAKFNLTVQNSSDNYETASGFITVYDFFGNKAGVIKLNPEIILANSSRSLLAQQQTGQPIPLSWGEKFLLGPYSATATVYLDGTKKISGETRFFAIPVIILVILVALFFIILSIALKVIRKVNIQE
ncbi:MAG: hypothetical protein ACM3IJ_04515 [Candidatus Levyibacteriota bacterium]